MTHLVQILLPLRDNDGRAYPDKVFESVHGEIVERFGGLTAYSRAPAKGKWLVGGREQRDDIVVLEVMVTALDRNWWKIFRKKLEAALRQDEIIIRAQAVERL